MDRYEYEQLPFGELVPIQPHPRFEIRRDFNGAIIQDPPSFEELVELHDEWTRDQKLALYNARPRSRWTVIDENTLLRERYDGKRINSLELPSGYKNAWSQSFRCRIAGKTPIIEVQFAPGEHWYDYKSPVTFHHDFLDAWLNEYSGPHTRIHTLMRAGERDFARDLAGNLKIVDRISSDGLKSQGDSSPIGQPVNFTVPTLWQKDWVTVDLIPLNTIINLYRLRVRSSLFQEHVDCTEFMMPSGQRIQMLDKDGVTKTGLNPIGSIKVGETVYGLDPDKPTFFWYYTERASLDRGYMTWKPWGYTKDAEQFYSYVYHNPVANVRVPDKQPLLQQAKSMPKPPPARFAKPSKGNKSRTMVRPDGSTWFRPNTAAFDERYTFIHKNVTIRRPEQKLRNPETGLLTDIDAFPIVGRDKNGCAIRKIRRFGKDGKLYLHKSELVADGSGNYNVWTCELTESYDFVDEQEEGRYQRLLDKFDDEIEANLSDTWVHDEIAQEDHVSALLEVMQGGIYNLEEIQQFASDSFEIGAGGIVFEKHMLDSVRQDAEDAHLMNVKYLARALDTTLERAEELQSQLDIVTLGDNDEKIKWISRLQGRSRDMTSEDAYNWLAECSSALDELNDGTEEIEVSSTSDFTQADITITVSNRSDSRIDPAEEREVAVNEVAEMLDDGSGNPALAPAIMEEFSDLTVEMRDLRSVYRRKPSAPPVKIRRSEVEVSPFLKRKLSENTYIHTTEWYDSLRANAREEQRQHYQIRGRLAAINLEGQRRAISRGHENRQERRDLLKKAPGVISAVKLVNAMTRYGLASNSVEANEKLRDVVAEAPVIGFNALVFANQFYGAPMPGPARPDRDWVPPAEDVHLAELAIEQEIINVETTNPFDAARNLFFANAAERDKPFRYVQRRQFSQTPSERKWMRAEQLVQVRLWTPVIEPVYQVYGQVQMRWLEPGERIPDGWRINFVNVVEDGQVVQKARVWRMAARLEQVDVNRYDRYQTHYVVDSQMRDVSQSDTELTQPFSQVGSSPSYGYHKIESNNTPDNPYTQMVVLEKKLWDLDNLSRNGKPLPLWRYRIYPKWRGIDGQMVRMRRQATEQYLAWHHKDAPPPPPILGVHNGGWEDLNGTNIPFNYTNAEWKR